MTHDVTGNAEGQTPLDEDELGALRLTYVTTRGDLDAAEQVNMVRGESWALRRPAAIERILDDLFLRRLHRQMFGEVWRWAGEYRRSNKNIGIDWPLVTEAVRNLCEDAEVRFGVAGESRARDLAAVEFHHRLVSIHPFVNGNGRHARLVADLLARADGRPRFTWGGASGSMPTAEGDPARTAYLAALRAADGGELDPLVAFARS